MPIQILPPEIASQIAAGEVVERPASVVKELLENSLDAKSKSISIQILDAGRRLIEVSDDGCGIPPDQLALALARHATSKLSRFEDLYAMKTLGFRGEALASIGSISNLTIISRTSEANGGTKIQMKAGSIEAITPAPLPPGTLVRVEDLFHNVPARSKFLKTDMTERRVINNLVTRYALAYPHVRFRFSEGKYINLQTSGNGDQRSILASLYGMDVAKNLLEVDNEEPGIRIKGFISPTSITRSNRREITFFINGRWVQDTPLSTALTNAYHTLLMVARYPMAVLFIEINPEEVDVNVHPAKAEVRFRDQDRVFRFVQHSARQTLLAFSPIPAIPMHSLWTDRLDGDSNIDPAWTFKNSEPLPVSMESSGNELRDEQTSNINISTSNLFTTNLPLLRLIGQVGSKYIVAEGPDGLYLVDQHAAHERILFEKLIALHEHKVKPSQALLTPIAIQLSSAQSTMLEEMLPTLDHLGFHLESFGPGSYQLRAIPALFTGLDPASALRSLVDDFEEDEKLLQNELEARIAARVCKRFAVKAGQVLSTEEQRTLLSNLETCNSPRTCPHGRPTMIHLSVDLLERQFGRKGSL